MASDPLLSLSELRVLEAQVFSQPADPNGRLLLLKDGMLAVLRTAIAALEELENANPSQDP